MSVAETVSLAPPKSSTRLTSTTPLNQMVSMHNPIQLTAISNYKLAQLTFAAPDLHSMRKTALVKNMLEMLYEDTPPEWLDQMTRWVFFTPESLGDMTQEQLEEIFAQYAQTIEAFQPLSLDDDDDDDGEDADMWADVDDDHLVPHQVDHHVIPVAPVVSDPPSPIYTPTYDIVPSASDILPSDLPPSPVSLVEKPLPNNSKNPFTDRYQDQSNTQPNAAVAAIPTTMATTTTTSSVNRKSLTSGLRSKNRLSWTSDTGVAPSSAIVQHMASEMMTLFDMDFSVDIKLDTAPKLPELSFANPDDSAKHRRSAQRFSNDSLMGLINKFETFRVEDEQSYSTYNAQLTTPRRRSRLSHQMTFPPPPVEFPSDHLTNKRRSASVSVSNPPARSSSLKYRNQRSLTVSEDPKSRAKSKSNEFLSTLAHALGGGSSHHPHHGRPLEDPAEPDRDRQQVHKSRSVLRIASSLVKGNGHKHKKSANANTVDAASASSSSFNLADPVTHSQTTLSLTVPSPSDEHRKSISSTISSSSSWSSTSEILIARKASFRRHPINDASESHNNSNNPSVTPIVYTSDDAANKRRSFTALQPVVVEAQDLRRARSLGHNRYPTNKRKKKNRRSSLLMEKTVSKRKSIQQAPRLPETPDDLYSFADNNASSASRRKSTFIRIGRGFSNNNQQPKESAPAAVMVRQVDARRRSTLPPPPPSNDDTAEPIEKSFVKRMATLGRRMRLQRV